MCALEDPKPKSGPGPSLSHREVVKYPPKTLLQQPRQAAPSNIKLYTIAPSIHPFRVGNSRWCWLTEKEKKRWVENEGCKTNEGCKVKISAQKKFIVPFSFPFPKIC
jgi:hypothetical protein